MRARILQGIRAFFAERGVLEVDTPALSPAASTDPYLSSFVCEYRPFGAAADVPGVPLYLQTSPEFAMKRLLAAGSGPIYQICKAFRNGESGRCHSPEFTMLEWYRPGFDHHRLMDEVAALVMKVLAVPTVARISYGELFASQTGLDPHCSTVAALQQFCQQQQLSMPLTADDSVDDWLMFVMAEYIEPRLSPAPLLVYDFPSGQAMLARTVERADGIRVAQRFELYAGGLELANGFFELQDAAEQRRRFEVDLIRRQSLGLPAVPMDESLLDALKAGLPECAGVALGVDRLVMLAANMQSIHQVTALSVLGPA